MTFLSTATDDVHGNSNDQFAKLLKGSKDPNACERGVQHTYRAAHAYTQTKWCMFHGLRNVIVTDRRIRPGLECPRVHQGLNHGSPARDWRMW